ncbi:hypothetical protein ASF83_13810 [Plantibacter sp. Leaf171]|nr:hypothetical protein ASF83_13810 [Plantibacter sp. Leaf171]
MGPEVSTGSSGAAQVRAKSRDIAESSPMIRAEARSVSCSSTERLRSTAVVADMRFQPASSATRSGERKANRARLTPAWNAGDSRDAAGLASMTSSVRSQSTTGTSRQEAMKSLTRSRRARTPSFAIMAQR